MAPSVANFLFEAVNVMLLVAALGWLFFKPVRAALEAERDGRAKEEAELAERRAQAEALAKEGRTAREQAERETEHHRAEMLTAAEQEAARIREQARRALDEQRRTATRELEASRRATAGALAETVGRIAAASVRRLLDSLDGPSLDLALVRGACDELRALAQVAPTTASVESARPLDAEARTLLHDVLGERFAERTVAELGAGVRITTASGQVDASALAIAHRAARDVASVVAGEASGAEAPDG